MSDLVCDGCENPCDGSATATMEDGRKVPLCADCVEIIMATRETTVTITAGPEGGDEPSAPDLLAERDSLASQLSDARAEVERLRGALEGAARLVRDLLRATQTEFLEAHGTAMLEDTRAWLIAYDASRAREVL